MKKTLLQVHVMALICTVVFQFGEAATQITQSSFVETISVSGDQMVASVVYANADASIFDVNIVKLADFQTIRSADALPLLPNMVALNSNGQLFAYGTAFGSIEILNVTTATTTTVVQGGAVEIGALNWHPSLDLLAYSQGGSVTIIEVATGIQIASTFDSTSRGIITSVSWNETGDNLGTTSFDFAQLSATTQLWDDSLTGLMSSPSSRILNAGGSFIRWSSDGTFVALPYNNSVGVFNVPNGQLIRDLVAPNESTIYSAVWSPDGSRIAAGSEGFIWIWNSQSGELLETIPMTSAVTAIEWATEELLLHNGGAEGLYIYGVPVDSSPRGDRLIHPVNFAS